jgi:hypothetical protein
MKKSPFILKKLSKTILMIFILAWPSLVFADHGPGSLGSKSGFVYGRLLDLNAYEFRLSNSFVEFENLSKQYIKEEVVASQKELTHFESLQFSDLTSFEISWSLASFLEVTVSGGYYYFHNLREGLLDFSKTYYFVEAGSIGGMTDPQINLKVPLIQDMQTKNFLAISVAVGLPFGRQVQQSDAIPFAELTPAPNLTSNLTTAGHLVDKTDLSSAENAVSLAYAPEPSVMPGSGAFNLISGLGFTQVFGKKFEWNFSLLHSYFFANNQYQIGQSVSLGWQSSFKAMQISDEIGLIIGNGLSASYKFASMDAGDNVSNTGGFNLHYSLHIAFEFSYKLQIMFGPSWPLIQQYLGSQQKMEQQFNTSILAKNLF